MYAAKNVGSGLSALGQVFYGVYALTLYDDFDPNGEKSTTQVWDDLYKKITFYEPVEGTHREAAFGHLNGYGSGYYGYMWSKVFAQDMFSRFEEEGVLNPEVGKNYRDMVLARGGTREEMEMLREFLGREPNQDAFVKSLGL
jgi:thimet oligopeptidase